ncbi:MAG: response regulator, partial [Candidatus Parcubacteria bacterium]|nr:response regulator [Burkholderiales bacterium]
MRVLVVDDVQANCRLAQLLLRGFGHEAEAAFSGLDAVERVVAGRFDLVLMDIELPDIDGMEAARRIRERLGFASPRIIAMTANDQPGFRERCRAGGMDDYVRKPIDQLALRAAVGQQGPAAAAPASVAAAPAAKGAIDWSRIESFKPFDPDGSLVAAVIASFLADAPGRIRAIREGYAGADQAGVAAAAHALKGSAAN